MTALRLFVGRLSHSFPVTKIPTTSALPTLTSIAAFCKEGRLNDAVDALHNVQHIVDSSAYVCLLQCCSRKEALDQGKRIHALIFNRNHIKLREDIFLHNTLLQMYVKCGSLVDACGVFDEMLERNVFSWNVMIAAYRKQELSEEVLALFHRMQRSGNGVQPDEFTFPSVLAACLSLASLEEGVDIHRIIIRSGFHTDVVVTNALINLYANFENMQKARVLFDKMKDRTTISWNAMITGYAQKGFHEEALEVFEGMQQSGAVPNEFTLLNVILCVKSASLQDGLDIHGKIVRSGFISDVVVTNALIDMYVKFGSVQKARVLFDKMQERDTISWTTMISGYAQNGYHEEALEVFKGMQQSGVEPDVVGTSALIDMYAKFGNIQKARVLFDQMQQKDTISWNAMISGYAQNGFHEEALEVFEGMQRNGIAPNEFTFSSVLQACARSPSLQKGVDIHGKIVRSGFHSDVVVTNALVDMYAKFRNIQKARKLFDKMKDRTTVSWNAMIAGYAHNGLNEEALEVFEEMQRNGVVQDVVATSALIDMYAKFGNIEKARVLFDKMQQRNTISWTAMITVYAQNGFGLEALKCFQKMQLTGFRPDSITFVSILPVCATFAALKWGTDIHGQIIR